MSDKKQTYEELRHLLDSSMLGASKIATEQEQQDFVTGAFIPIYRNYADKIISHADYLRLVNRLAAYAGGAFNDYLDLLTGAAMVGMLNAFLAKREDDLAAQARKRRQSITDMTGVQPIRPEE